MSDDRLNHVVLTGLSLIHESPFKSMVSSATSPTAEIPSRNDSLYGMLKSEYEEHNNNINASFMSDGNNIPDSLLDNSGLNLLNDSYKVYLSELSNSLINNTKVTSKSSNHHDGKVHLSINTDTNNTADHRSFPHLKDINLSEDMMSIFDVTKNSNTNDLILKILIENSLYNLNLYLKSDDSLDFLNPSSMRKKNNKGKKSTTFRKVDNFFCDDDDATSKDSNVTILSLNEIKALKRKIINLYEESNQIKSNISETINSLKDIVDKYEKKQNGSLGSSGGVAGVLSSITGGTSFSRELKIEMENISQINTQLEKQLIKSSLMKYLQSHKELEQLKKEISINKKKLFLHFFTCLIIGYINNIEVNLKLQKNLATESILSPTSSVISSKFDYLKSPTFASPIFSASAGGPLSSSASSITGAAFGVNSSKTTYQMIENKTAIFNKSLDEIVNCVASIAVQRGIKLPEPNSNNMLVGNNYSVNNNSEILEKTSWIKNCINTILTKQVLNDSIVDEINGIPNNRKNLYLEDNLSEASLTSPIIGRNENNNSSSVLKDREIIELKTKIKDLKFANQYLTKQFTNERESFHKIISEQQQVKNELEKKLNNSILNLEKTNLLLIQNETTNQGLQKKLNENFQSITSLKKQLAELRINNLDSIDSNNANSMNGDMDGSKGTSNTNDHDSGVGMMRKEFKKIIDDLNKQHFQELSEERTERQRLEKLLKLYKSV